MNPADVRWLAEKVVAEAFFSISDAAVLALAKRVLELEQPVAHEHSPVLVEQPVMHVDPAAPGSERTVAVLHVPVDERKVAEAYREKVLAAFREWDMRPGDTRTWHQVVMEVGLP